MKLFLTSAGIRNNSLKQAFYQLVDKRSRDTHIVFIPTASNVERGDKGWMVTDMVNLRRTSPASLDVIDISALPREKWEPAMRAADVIVCGGGNTYYLQYWVEKSGLAEILPELLETKVYMGISAGSCITGPKLAIPLYEQLFPDEQNEFDVQKGLGLVDFYIVPHLNSRYFENLRMDTVSDLAEEMKNEVYALDDESAVVVNGRDISVVSEGEYLEFNS